MNPTKKLPLFIVTGASGVGKSSACAPLFEHETDYLVMESDLLWHSVYNTPGDGYRAFRALWLNVAASISQIGKPVVLAGCAIPEHFERCDARPLFSAVHYLALVCQADALVRRLRDGRGVADEGWIQSSLAFNRWLQENASRTAPPLALLDTTGLTPAQSARACDAWIAAHYKKEKL